MNKPGKEAAIIAIAVVAVLFAVGTMAWQILKAPSANAAPLAACLKEKNVTMYGAYWCPHCQNQKRMFGDAFAEVPYVECTENEDACTKANIQGFPTWVFPDGKIHVGEYKSLAEIAADAGCPAPDEN